jgi:hypothetical protein
MKLAILRPLPQLGDVRATGYPTKLQVAYNSNPRPTRIRLVLGAELAVSPTDTGTFLSERRSATSGHVADKLGAQRVDPAPNTCRSRDGDSRSRS